MTRDFENFLKHFTEEIENAQIETASIHDKEASSNLDHTVLQLMEFAERVYSEDVTALLTATGVQQKMTEMKARIDLNMEQFNNFQMAADWRHFNVSYYGESYSRAILHLEEAIRTYFKTPKDSPEFYFITAFLAKDDNFIVIQLYHFLESIRH